MLARPQRGRDEGVRGLDAAHALHHDVDVGVGDDLVVVRRHAGIGESVGKLEDARDLEVRDAGGDDLVDAAADGSKPEDGDFHLVFPIL